MTRPHPRRHARRAAAALALVAVSVGCSGNASTSSGPSQEPTGTPTSVASPTTKPPPRPPRPPDVGACRRLDYAAISHYSNADATVSCAAPHTAYTFAVRTIPANVSVSGVSIGNRSIQDAASRGCRKAFGGFIGGTSADRALSRLSVTYFLPDQRGFNRGAHWVRCDVVALKTFNALAALPRDLERFLDKPASLEAYGVCTTGEPGAPSSRLVMCAGKHAYRALAALRLGAESARYPGRAAAGPEGQQRCSTYIADTLGTNGGYTFGWTYPTVSDWAAGQRFGYCWLKSAR